MDDDLRIPIHGWKILTTFEIDTYIIGILFWQINKMFIDGINIILIRNLTKLNVKKYFTI